MTPAERQQKSKEIADEVSNEFRKKFLAVAAKEGLTMSKLARRLNDALDAKEVKVFNDKDDGIVYSRPLIDNTTRINALKLSAEVFGLKAAEKVDMNHSGSVVIMKPDAINKPADSGLTKE